MLQKFIQSRMMILCLISLGLLISAEYLIAQNDDSGQVEAGAIETDWHGFEMVYVPGGSFEMGVDRDILRNLCIQWGEPDAERCVEVIEEDTGSTYMYSVEIQPFWIDRYEFTIEKFEELCGEISYTDLDACIDLSRTPELAENPQQPQVGVNWYAAEFMCNLRGARLPTEEEWEYAASGPEKLIFPWGNSFIDEYTHLPNASPEETYPVGSIPENRSWIGAYDMAGNAAEWMEDYYLPRILANASPENWPRSNPITNFLEISRVIRGGSWEGRIRLMTTFYREYETPEAGSTFFGFRCARTLLSSEQ